MVVFPLQYESNIQAVFLKLNMQLGFCSPLGETSFFKIKKKEPSKVRQIVVDPTTAPNTRLSE